MGSLPEELNFDFAIFLVFDLTKWIHFVTHESSAGPSSTSIHPVRVTEHY